MDEYKEYFYNKVPHYRSIDPGNISMQKAIREKLQCKPFKWFMEDIAFDILWKYPLVKPPTTAYGEVK